MFSYHFNNTEDIKNHLTKIEALRISFENLRVLPQLEEKIRRASILRSAVFSARIEGNPLNLQNVNRFDDKELHKIEINNLSKSYHQLYTSTSTPKLTTDTIKNLHQQVMNNLSSMAGKYRQEPWAIFDNSGNIIHLAPPYHKLTELMDEFIIYLKQLESHPAINSAITQFVFEKIHPFADGNGRAGRLLSALILKQHNFHFRGMLSFEEYTDIHRQAYYYALEPSKDMTEFIEYFLKSLVITAHNILKQLQRQPSSTPELSPRREEILAIITDHPNCSFNFLARRFPSLNPKTLHYDLLQLQKKGILKKLGTTRAVVYSTN